MKQLRYNLTKFDIAGVRNYRKWYRAFEETNEVRVFINELLMKNGERVNKFIYTENRALICIGATKENEWFFNKYKNYDMKFFIRSNVGTVYSEYEVKEWHLLEDCIEVIFN